MKFITVCVLVCAIALNFSINFANTQQEPSTTVVNTLRTIERHHRYQPPSFKSILQHQYNALVDRINATWIQCNEAFDELKSIQKLDPMSNTHKCLIDCTLRTMGVITHRGLGDDQYMLHMRQLQANQTSDGTKHKTFAELNHQLSHLVRNGTCEAIVGTSKPDPYFSDLCNVLIESYSLAAGKCTELRDSYGDNCQSSYMIVTCLARRHRGKLYDSPFSKVFMDQREAVAVA